MSDAFTGGCACGAIRYEISAKPLFMNHCQCRDCQQTSGTGHGSYLTFPNRAAVKLTGQANHWDKVADSGNVKTRGFCPSCGTPVYLTFAAMPVQAAGRDLSPARLRLGPARPGRTGLRHDAAGRLICGANRPVAFFLRRHVAFRRPRSSCVREQERRSGMIGSNYRWVIVAAGGLLGCVAIGGMFSLPVLLQPIAHDTGWSVAGISSAMTIGFLAMACSSMIWGTLSDRFGPLPVVLTGSIVIAGSLALASRATSLIEFQLLFGLLVGAATAAIFAPMMATVTGWFDTHRSLAVSLVSAGMGMAPLTMSPMVAWLVSSHDWRTTMQIVAAVVAAIMIPVSLLVRRPPGLAAGAAAPVDTVPQPDMTRAQAIRSPQFIILLATNFFCCATHSGPIIHTVSYAISCGIPLIAAVSIYSVEGLAGLFGRIGFGLMGDRFGAKRVLVIGLLVQAFGALAYVFVRELAGFYAVAVLFGFIYAGVMPLYAVLVRENFPLRMLGTVIGGTAMAGSLGMATGPIAGGLIYDTFASYAWLYIGAWGMGLGAFLMAMAFRPFPRRQAEAITVAA
jgi:MFS family permease